MMGYISCNLVQTIFSLNNFQNPRRRVFQQPGFILIEVLILNNVYYIKDNVLLSAVTSETEDPGGFIPQVPITPIDKSIDRSTLKPYIIENANTIKNTVMKDVLGYK